MKNMKKFGRGGSQYPESDPRNPMNREGMDLVRERQAKVPGKQGGPKDKKAGGGKVGYKKGGSVSKRADGCAQRGKTRGKMV